MSGSEVHQFVPAECRLRLAPLFRAQGYRDLDRVLPPIRLAAEAMLAEARALVAPRVFSTRRRVAGLTADALTLAGGPTFHGRCFRTHLGPAALAVPFIVTLGPALDARVDELSAQGDMLEALFLDTLGSLAIQETVRGFRLHLTASAREGGYEVSARLGPGYHDWPLTEQRELFELFASPLPVALTDGSVMAPLKSLSGLYALRTAAGR